MDVAFGRGAIVAMFLDALRARTRLPIRSAMELGRGIGDAIRTATETPSRRQSARVAAHGASAAASWWPETPHPPCSGLHNRCEAHRRIGCMAAAAHAAHEAWAHLDGRLAELFATARLELRALLSGPVDGPRCVGPLGHDLFRLRGHGRAIRRLRLVRVTISGTSRNLCVTSSAVTPNFQP
jgi:hypothetical protein